MSTPAAPRKHLEVDSAANVTVWDSFYTDSDQTSLTHTLASSVKKYKYEWGRRYHAYKAGEWFLPNDEPQQDQMDLFHEVYTRGQGGLFLAPIEDPKKCLDLGTGTGIWAIQFADMFPNCQVIGNDLSPIQPAWVPSKCSFEVDDFNEDWPFPPNTFDYIHARAIHGAVKDWGALSKKAYDALKPGGWFEVCNEYPAIGCDDNTYPADSPIRSWMKNAMEGCEIVGKTAMPHLILEDCISKAGFDMSTYRQFIFKVPIGVWPKGREAKELGAMNMLNLVMGVEGFLMVLYTKYLGISPEDARQEIEDIRVALRNKRQHLWLPMHTTFVQKPFDAPQDPVQQHPMMM